MINIPKPIAGNEICQIGDRAEAILVQEVTNDARRSGVTADIQLVFRYPNNGELRAPVTVDALTEIGLDSPNPD